MREGKNNEPKTESVVNNPQSVKEAYQVFIDGVGRGENPLFLRSESDIVFKNTVGEEKPLLYVYNPDGSIKKWLTQSEVDEFKKTSEQNTLNDEQLFDMFSFMVGGRRPGLRDLDVTQWTDLITEYQNNNVVGLDKIRRVFEFVDKNPDTNLTLALGNVLGLSVDGNQRFEVVNEGKKGMVFLMGDTSWSRDKIFVWHPIRNMRSSIQSYSPFKSDGCQNVGDICDIQVGYQGTDGPRIVRLNKIVFLMARYGLGEQTTPKTSLDQIYMSPNEFIEQLWIPDGNAREEQHRLENENFVINKRLQGSRELIFQKKQAIVTKMLDMAKKGELDVAIKNIEQFT